MNYGAKIKQRRKELDLSVDELAEKIGKSRATVYRYENGNIEDMPVTIIEPLAKALETTPGYLIGWDATYYSLDDIINSLPSACYEDILSYSRRLLHLTRNGCATPEHSLVEQMHTLMCSLNEVGQQEAVSRVEELTYLTKYSLPQDCLPILDTSEADNKTDSRDNITPLVMADPRTSDLRAAHQREGATPEELQHDEDIMNNENLWKE